MASNQIFLHITGGRTVWVPAHKAAPHELKPVQILTSVTPMELSRSFYLYDYPIQVVEDPRQAAVSPNCKTVQDVVVAVNEFRRACQADHDYLFQRCYDAKKSHPAMTASQPASSLHPTTQNDLLTQLLQQRQQQQQQQQQPMIPNTLLNAGASLDPAATSVGGVLGNLAGGGGGPSGGGRYHSRAQANFMGPYGSKTALNDNKSMMMMMGVGMPPAAPSTFNAATMMLGGGVAGANAAHGNYAAANNPGNLFFPNNMLPSMMMMPQGPFGHPSSPNPSPANGAARVGPYNGETRREPEPIEIKVKIPDEILRTYTNPSQALVCATMPGPRMTVWLREHPVPENKKDLKYVFCKGGIVLMLKAQGSEVKESKPVELFPKQICTHFLIHGYCSRTNCLHEHHSEEQLRRLIAARHVELKALTKKERHHLIEAILQKEQDGLRAAEVEREARQRQRQSRPVAKPSSTLTGLKGSGKDSEERAQGLDNLSEDSNHPQHDLEQEKSYEKEQSSAGGTTTEARAMGEAAGLVGGALGGSKRSSQSTAMTTVPTTIGGGIKGVANVSSIGVTDSGDEDSSDDSSSSSSSSSSGSPASSDSDGDKEEKEKEKEEKVGEREKERSSPKTAPAAKDTREATPIKELEPMEELGKKTVQSKTDKKKTPVAPTANIAVEEEEKEQPETSVVQKGESEAPTDHSEGEDASVEEPESEGESEEEEPRAKRTKKVTKAAPQKKASKKAKPDSKKRERSSPVLRKTPAKRTKK